MNHGPTRSGLATLVPFFAVTVLSSVGASAATAAWMASRAPSTPPSAATSATNATSTTSATTNATTSATSASPTPPPSEPSAPLPAADLAGTDGSGGVVSMADVVTRVIPAVVNVASLHAPQSPYGSPYDLRPSGPRQSQGGESLGSGVIVSSDGLVVTNNHVVAGASEIRVTLSDGRELAAQVVGTDEDSDMALLRLASSNGQPLQLTAMPYGDSSQLRQGDVVLAIGNPFGVGQTVTMGIVSATGRANVGITDLEDFIQTDAAINPGNSGGALISMRGELIGINTAILSRTGGSHGIGFAIPSAMVQPIVRSLLEHGKVVRGWLGVSIQDLSPELARSFRLSEVQQGVLVNGTEEGSPAASAGVQAGDVIEQIDGERLRSSSQLRTLVATRGANADIALTIVRNGERRQVSVHLGERPQHTATSPAAPLPIQPRTSPQAQGALPPGLLPPGMVPDLYGRGQPQAQAPRLQGGQAVAGLAIFDLDARLRGAFGIPASVRGALVGDVASGSPGDLAGLQAGDVILEVDHAPIASAAQFARAYSAHGGGVVVLARRGAQTLYTVLH